MALHEIMLEYNIIDAAITINPGDAGAIVIAVLHHGGYSLFEWPVSTMIEKPPYKTWVTPLNQKRSFSGFMYLQVAFGSELNAVRSILVLSNNIEASMLWIFGTDGVPLGEISSHDTAIEGLILNGHRSMSRKYLVIDDDSESSRESLDIDLATLNEHSGLELAIAPFPVARMDAICYGGAMRRQSEGTPFAKDIVFSLSENGSLFANKTRLIRNCTSFIATPAHLILTTSQNLLKFVHMMDAPEGMSLLISLSSTIYIRLTMSCRT